MFRWWTPALTDLRYAVRSLRRTPGFVLMAVLTLAPAIGANSATFSVVSGVLLQPLPCPDADRLVWVFTTWPNRRDPPVKLVSYPDYQDLAAGAGVLERVALFGNARPPLTGGGAGVARAHEHRVMERRGSVPPSAPALLRIPPARGAADHVAAHRRPDVCERLLFHPRRGSLSVPRKGRVRALAKARPS